MRKLLICIVFICSSFMVAQPLPKCFTAKKRLFLTCNNDTLLYKTDINILESIGSLESCFRIRDIKDSLRTRLFKIEFYQSDKVFRKKSEKKMQIFLTRLTSEDSFNYYLNIPNFKEGIFFIDVSNKSKIKIVKCQSCRDSIEALDISPQKWYKMKRWKN